MRAEITSSQMLLFFIAAAVLVVLILIQLNAGEALRGLVEKLPGGMS